MNQADLLIISKFHLGLDGFSNLNEFQFEGNWRFDFLSIQHHQHHHHFLIVIQQSLTEEF